MNTYTHLTLLIDSIPYQSSTGEVIKPKITKLRSTINNKRKSSWRSTPRVSRKCSGISTH